MGLAPSVSTRDTATSVIETDGLTKTYKGISALENLSLAVPRYRIFGLLGPNGAGRSTTGCLLGEAVARVS